MSENKVTSLTIESIMEATDFHEYHHNNKVTIVVATLPNGFTIVESSACVDPANYDAHIGASICKKRIENKLWELEGYLLQEQLHKDKTN